MKKVLGISLTIPGLIAGSRGAFFGENPAKNNANQARLPWKRKINKK